VLCCVCARVWGDPQAAHTHTNTHTPHTHTTRNGGPRREAESGSDLLGRLSCSSTAHQSTNASIPSRGKENSSGATTTRPLLISRGGTTPVHNAVWQPSRRNVEGRLPVHQSHSRNPPQPSQAATTGHGHNSHKPTANKPLTGRHEWHCNNIDAL